VADAGGGRAGGRGAADGGAAGRAAPPGRPRHRAARRAGRLAALPGQGARPAPSETSARKAALCAFSRRSEKGRPPSLLPSESCGITARHSGRPWSCRPCRQSGAASRSSRRRSSCSCASAATSCGLACARLAPTGRPARLPHTPVESKTRVARRALTRGAPCGCSGKDLPYAHAYPAAHLQCSAG